MWVRMQPASDIYNLILWDAKRKDDFKSMMKVFVEGMGGGVSRYMVYCYEIIARENQYTLFDVNIYTFAI